MECKQTLAGNFFREVNGEENIIEISEEDCVGNFAPNSIPIHSEFLLSKTSSVKLRITN